jgi:hypothetical protein
LLLAEVAAPAVVAMALLDRSRMNEVRPTWHTPEATDDRLRGQLRRLTIA